MLQFRKFQREDLARLAVHDGGILSWDTGLGKTLGQIAWALLKVGCRAIVTPDGRRTVAPAKPVLLIAPGDLHGQMLDDAREHYGSAFSFIPLDSQAAFLSLNAGRRTSDGRCLLDPGFYITSYTQLGLNGTLDMPTLKDGGIWTPRTLIQHCCLKPEQIGVPFFAKRAEVWKAEYKRMGFKPEGTIGDLRLRYKVCVEEVERIKDDKLRGREMDRLRECLHILSQLCCELPCPTFNDLNTSQQDFVLRHGMNAWLQECAVNDGVFGEYLYGPDGIPGGKVFFRTADNPGPDEPSHRIKCVYSPTLADLCHDAFDAVTVDEGVRMKGGVETCIGQGVLTLTPKFRCVLSGTPIKNRLPDIFWLVWWATGGRLHAHGRWPYSANPSEKQRFAEEFMVKEFNLTKAAGEEAGKLSRQQIRSLGSAKDNKRFQKLRPEVCNVHRLWKLLAPAMLRRRKDDCGEEIVAKIHKVYPVPMGRHQKETYGYHLSATYVDRYLKPAPGAQLQALRTVAADPSSDLLVAKPVRDEKLFGKHRSAHDYTPKISTVLNLIQQLVAQGEQVLVGAAFHQPLHTLSRYLNEANVPHLVLHGDVTQKKRGKLAKLFQAGRTEDGFPVTLAGMDSMAEGYNFHRCSHVVVMAYSWAYDKLIQFINRVHRMVSKKDVTVHVVIAEGTIDRKLESLQHEKKDAAELVCDGRLITEASEDVNLAELLKVAFEEFDEESKTIDERELAKEWPKLRDNLRQASAQWFAEAIQTTAAGKPITPPAPAPVIRPAFTPPKPPVTLTTATTAPLSAPKFVLPWKRRLAAAVATA